MVTTDSIKIQLQNLIQCHEYQVDFKLNNPSTLSASLDKETMNFTASSNKQNVFVLLTKSNLLPMVHIEVIITDLTDNTKAINSMFIQCSDYSGCGDDLDPSYFLS
jgi:hypothetical protein